MPISFINKGTWAAGSTSFSPGIPASMHVGDLMILVCHTANQAVTKPSGWTEITSSPVSTGTAGAAGGVRLTAYYRWWVSGDTPPTVSVSGGSVSNGIIFGFRNVDQTNPFDATSIATTLATASTTLTWGSITTVSNDALILLASARDQDLANTAAVASYTNANLTGLTEIHDQVVSTSVGGGVCVAYGFQATAGAVGSTTATQTSSKACSLTIALRFDGNLISNPGFEDGVITPWVAYGANFTAVNSNSHTGGWSGKVLGGDGGDLGITLAASTSYRLSGWFKKSSTQHAEFGYRLFDEADAPVTDYVSSSSVTDTYSEIVHNFTTTADTLYVLITIYNDTGGDLYVDDLYLGVSVAATELSGDAQDVATATASLSTSIKLAEAAQALATATAALSAGIPLSGNAVAMSTANGALYNLPTALAGASLSVATASGTLSTQIPLSGGAAALATSLGALSTNIPMSGNAVDTASTTGSLSSGIKLAGSAQDVASTSGSIGTGIKLAGNSQAIAASNTILTAMIMLTGSALAQALASAGLTALIKLAGDANDSATATGALTTGGGASQLSGDAKAQALASASLTIQIRLSGTAVVAALAQAGLSSTIALEGHGTSQASASSNLNTAIPLLGNAQAFASASGNLTNSIKLAAASLSVAFASGDLTVGVTLSASAISQALAAGNLFAVISLAANSLAEAQAAAEFAGGYRIPTSLLAIETLTPRYYLRDVTPLLSFQSLGQKNRIRSARAN